MVLVRPGARIPADGEIVDGSADVDESMITGESRPVAKQPGETVDRRHGRCRQLARVKVSATGDQTALSGIMRMVAQAQASASRAQALADRAAALLFYIALAAGTITLVFWWLQGDHEGALVRTATVLVIACPHALGPGHPAGHRHLDLAGRAQRPPHQGPDGAGARPHPRHGHLRQDRHAHQGRAGADRRRGGEDPDETSWDWRQRSRPTRSTRWPGPSSRAPRPGD